MKMIMDLGQRNSGKNQREKNLKISEVSTAQRVAKALRALEKGK